MTIAENSWLVTPIARHIWETKYRWQETGKPPEGDIEETWQRVARTVAAVEPAEQQHWEAHFLGILRGFRFLPGGRILAGAGTDRRVTLFNCFVMGLIEDDMESIFEALKEGALTMQAGGGVGYDFSTLRPVGSVARSTGRIASGPVSFMHIWDAMCTTVLSTGARRGAMIASLRCDHPDIETFIDAKREPGRLRHFNLSVQVTDAFMEAVEADRDWPLVFPDTSLKQAGNEETVLYRWPGFAEPVPCQVLTRRPARKLWERIMRAAYDTAEPGVLFTDRINEFNNLAYRESVTTTNPCGEIPLPPYGACNLGSINLVRFVQNPFTATARLDLDAIQDSVGIATRLLDNVIDCSDFPLEKQAKQARGSRRIGLGITGLADALIMLGLHYGQAAARHEAARVMQTVCHAAYRTSIELARDKGSFPLFTREAYSESSFVRSLPEDIRAGIREHGIRNSHLTAIAPTGTISLLANNVSSGIEPVFDFRVSRKVLNREGNYERFNLEDYALRVWGEQGNDKMDLPPEFVDARSIPPNAHLEMQAVLQPHVDSAISKTINVPDDCTFHEFQDLYRMAWNHGLKGCTTFRSNPVTGEILSPETAQEQPDTERDAHCCNIEREGE
ncbi:MAG: adenosylcobalamin-dependent ribonucleoside-diphosphate reductase [Gammaproteobacteria bacterium]|nr:MAG: adenosylcobalamin-dependent ribonucleoside-diphosphate reductase [Gammaproteobacteria bacterium]